MILSIIGNIHTPYHGKTTPNLDSLMCRKGRKEMGEKKGGTKRSEKESKETTILIFRSPRLQLINYTSAI
jgi:hypothetical protein